MRNKIYSFLTVSIFIFLTLSTLLLFIKGNVNNNTLKYQYDHIAEVGGPFEGTNSSSRYALVESMVERHTFELTEGLARFSASDIVRINGKFYTIFMPGISFMSVPFYLLGRHFAAPQLGTYAFTILCAIVNVFLIYVISRKLNVSRILSIIAGLVFLFATNALNYALLLTQHHFGTLLILMGILNLFGKRTVIKDISLGMLVGLGLLADIPNPLIMFPIVLIAIFQHFSFEDVGRKIKISFKLSAITMALALIPFIGIIAWYNHAITGSYTTVVQLTGRYEFPDPHRKVTVKNSNSEKQNEFDILRFPGTSRGQLSGLYILLVSDERGWFYYSPIVILGLLGLIVGYRSGKNRTIVIAAISVIGITLMEYSLHGDPWGGWSFGPRYLIPLSAIMAVFTGVFLMRFKSNLLVIIVFFALLYMSANINIMGALTTSQIPPKVEAINLINPIPYTYEYNRMLMEQNKSSSLFYNAVLKPHTPLPLFSQYLVYGFVGIIGFLYLLSLLLENRKEKK